MNDFSSNYQTRALCCIVFFTLCQLLSEKVDVLANFLVYVSPLEWAASLALVITGDLDTVTRLMGIVTLPNGGALGSLVRCTEAALLGTMFVHTISWIAALASSVSTACGVLFRATFLPIWLALALYKPLSLHVAQVAAFCAPLEATTPEIRRSLGFGILLLAIAVPLVVVFGAKLLSNVLWPEKSYRT